VPLQGVPRGDQSVLEASHALHPHGARLVVAAQ